MRLFQFSKPKNPGFGIGRDFYLTVLAAKASLPSVLEVINPQGEGGAVEGFGAPLAEGAKKEDLARPLERGVYVLASKDRKSVLRLRVISKEEAGFDPEPVVSSRLASKLSSEALARIRATWTLMQLSFESHDAMVYPSLNFLWSLARRLALLTDGVVADPIAERYLLPQETPKPPLGEKLVNAEDHISVRTIPQDSQLYAFTLGMRKFALPEFELADIDPSLDGLAESFLLSVCQTRLQGNPIQSEDQLGNKDEPFDVVEGGLDRARWEGIACYQLLPPKGKSADDALRAWLADQRRG